MGARGAAHDAAASARISSRMQDLGSNLAWSLAVIRQQYRLTSAWQLDEDVDGADTLSGGGVTDAELPTALRSYRMLMRRVTGDY